MIALNEPGSVIGEIIGGILLGPSALGLLPGHLTSHLFPTTALPTLSVLAQLGVVVFVFIVGLEVDLGLLRGRRRVAATVSLSSVALPFGLGVALALLMHSHFEQIGTHEVKLWPFALFLALQAAALLAGWVIYRERDGAAGNSLTGKSRVAR